MSGSSATDVPLNWSMSKTRIVSPTRRNSSLVPATSNSFRRSSGTIAVPGGMIFASTDAMSATATKRKGKTSIRSPTVPRFKAKGARDGAVRRARQDAHDAVRLDEREAAAFEHRLEHRQNFVAPQRPADVERHRPRHLGIDHVVELQGLAQHRGQHVANVGAGEIERDVARRFGRFGRGRRHGGGRSPDDDGLGRRFLLVLRQHGQRALGLGLGRGRKRVQERGRRG